MSENTTENQETDTKVKTKSETEYAETEENKKTVSESKEETSTVSESKAPEIIHTYEVIAGDLSWEDAKNACEERGGYLATITSEEEYEKISGRPVRPHVSLAGRETAVGYGRMETGRMDHRRRLDL